MQVTKVWWDGNKIMAEPIDPAAVYKDSLDSLLDEAKLLADDRPVEVGHLPQWTLDAEHMLRRLVKAFNSASQPAQQCRWPTCQSEEAQQELAAEIHKELVGEQQAQERGA